MYLARTPTACLMLLSVATGAHAEQSPHQALSGCIGIVAAADRLACFDAVAATQSVSAPAPLAIVPDTSAAQPAPAPKIIEHSRLSHEWELSSGDKHGIFSLRPHRQNYVLIANYSSAPNDAPFHELQQLAPKGQRRTFMSTEVKYQLSLKTKMVEDVSPLHIDVWAAYTQQSQWQAYNRKGSSPFRDTNYQPEIMAVMPMNVSVLGTKLRFVNVGLVHQSNGQALRLSRSWDRLYAQVGLERGDLTVLARLWQRRPEGGRNDNNADIIDYMGRGDIVATYHRKGHDFSIGARRNFSTDKGAVQIDWAFPLAPHLKGYVQSFSGYGQSLIDYNHKQTTFGFGLLMDY